MALILMIFVDGWYGMAVIGGGLTALLFGLNGLLSHTVVSFALCFFQGLGNLAFHECIDWQE